MVQRPRTPTTQRLMRFHFSRIFSGTPGKGFSGLLLLCALTTVLAACGSNQTQQQQSTPVILPPLPTIGMLPPGLDGLQPDGQVDPKLRLQLTIGLATDRQGLADELAALYDPKSPEFGKYLTPQQLASRYGASQANIDKVTTFLKGQGFQVLSVSPLKNQISVSATVAQIAQTFGVTLLTFQKNNQTVFSPSSAVTLPETLKSLVTSVVGLSTLAQPNPQAPRAIDGLAASDCAGMQRGIDKGGESANQIAAAYGYSNAYKAGYTGKGISIAVVEFNDKMSKDDLNNFLACTTKGKLHYSVVKVDGGAKVFDDGATGEAELDFEYLSSLAPDAQLIEYQDTYCDGSSNSWDCQKGQKGLPFPEAYINILNQIAADGKVQLASASWGNPEENFSQDEIFAFDQAIQYMAAEGITFAAASGDCGAYDSGVYTDLSIDIPSSDPYTLAVGGTELQTDDKGTRQSEPVWNTYGDTTSPLYCQYNDWGGGGGVSTLFKQPSWQAGNGVKNKYANGYRLVPDVAANAWIDLLYFQGDWYQSGGTSAATPIWIAGLALVDQGLVKHHKQIVGASPTFYRIANQKSKLHPYFDITKGDNLYYPATEGYDLSTGWGVPNIMDFGKALGAF